MGKVKRSARRLYAWALSHLGDLMVARAYQCEERAIRCENRAVGWRNKVAAWDDRASAINREAYEAAERSWSPDDGPPF